MVSSECRKCMCNVAVHGIVYFFRLYVLLYAANIMVCERNKDETKLLLGCDDGTLVSCS